MRNIILVVAVVVIIGFGILLLGFTSQEKGATQQPASQDQAPQQIATLPSTLYNLTGIVRTVQENSLIFEAKIPEIAEDNRLIHRLENRTVSVTSNTSITRLVFVLEETGQRRPQESEIDFHDLQSGDSIEVISNKDVREGQEIKATQIRVLPGS